MQWSKADLDTIVRQSNSAALAAGFIGSEFEEEREEVRAETLARVVEGFDPEHNSRLGAYASRVARNVCHEIWRRLSREQRVFERVNWVPGDNVSHGRRVRPEHVEY